MFFTQYENHGVKEKANVIAIIDEKHKLASLRELDAWS